MPWKSKCILPQPPTYPRLHTPSSPSPLTPPLSSIDSLKAGLPTAQHLHRAIRRTGTSLLGKHQVRHLRAFRLCVVREGPDVAIFSHPAALTKLALWIGEALAQQERDSTGRLSNGGRGTPLVVAGLDERRGAYVVVGTGGGGAASGAESLRGGGNKLGGEAAAAAKKKRDQEREGKARSKEAAKRAKEQIREQKREAKLAARRAAGGKDDDDGVDDLTESEPETESDESESDTDNDSEDEAEAALRAQKGFGVNKFGTAFQAVVEETSARVRIDSFENCVVEVKKEDLQSFLESLSMKAVVG